VTLKNHVILDAQARSKSDFIIYGQSPKVALVPRDAQRIAKSDRSLHTQPKANCLPFLMMNRDLSDACRVFDHDIFVLCVGWGIDMHADVELLRYTRCPVDIKIMEGVAVP
jgi:hypothetical protein